MTNLSKNGHRFTLFRTLSVVHTASVGLLVDFLLFFQIQVHDQQPEAGRVGRGGLGRVGGGHRAGTVQPTLQGHQRERDQNKALLRHHPEVIQAQLLLLESSRRRP